MSSPERENSPQGPLVWYASYGSNLSYEGRFMCYIAGGTPVGAEKANPGSRDKTRPLDIKPILFNWDLYFADYSKSWGGAPGFIRQGRPNAVTYGRMYLISDDQFNDVVLQENGRSVDGTRFIPVFEQLKKGSEFILPGSGLYGKLVKVGQEVGYPIFTFTTYRDLKIGAPSEAYLKIIIAGIKETYPAMTNQEICAYLMGTDGVRNNISPEQMALWVRETGLVAPHK